MHFLLKKGDLSPETRKTGTKREKQQKKGKGGRYGKLESNQQLTSNNLKSLNKLGIE